MSEKTVLELIKASVMAEVHIKDFINAELDRLYDATGFRVSMINFKTERDLHPRSEFDAIIDVDIRFGI